MIQSKNAVRLVLFLSVALLPINGFSMTLLSKDEALKQVLPDADKIETANRALTSAEIDSVKKRLGGSLVHYQKGANQDTKETVAYDFYYGIKNNEKTGVAVIEKQPGKWGPIEFIIALDAATGKVKNLAVMSYSEKRGRPIARNNFLSQFIGKGSSDKIEVQKDIRAISGATISSDSACFAVKKVIALYEVLFLNK